MSWGERVTNRSSQNTGNHCLLDGEAAIRTTALSLSRHGGRALTGKADWVLGPERPLFKPLLGTHNPGQSTTFSEPPHSCEIGTIQANLQSYWENYKHVCTLWTSHRHAVNGTLMMNDTCIDRKHLVKIQGRAVWSDSSG